MHILFDLSLCGEQFTRHEFDQSSLTGTVGSIISPPPTPQLPTQEFGFGFVFGDDMVLQQAPVRQLQPTF